MLILVVLLLERERKRRNSGLLEKGTERISRMTSFNVVFCRIRYKERSEVLVNNLFLFWRFDDHGHHYEEKKMSKEITQKLKNNLTN